MYIDILHSVQLHVYPLEHNATDNDVKQWSSSVCIFITQVYTTTNIVLKFVLYRTILDLASSRATINNAQMSTLLYIVILLQYVCAKIVTGVLALYCNISACVACIYRW